jgi:thiamine-phosphate pyrophosphorylase
MRTSFDLARARLYAFIDTAYLHGKDPTDVARQLCAGGADMVQLRAKGLPEKEAGEMARCVAPILQDAGVALVINDFPVVAAEVGAAFCHLGQEDFFDAGFERVSDVWTAHPETALQPKPRVGLSTHAPEQAARAMKTGADYVAIGPVFATPTKPTAAAVTLEYVRWAAANCPVPWFAIGGINLQNLDQVLEAGATRVCVVSAILNAPDVAAACRAFRARLPE